MSDLDLKDLRLVRAIAEQGGVTKAARHLCLSQSAVSHHLARVEERLGVELFVRAGRGLRITAAGERTVEVARQVGVQLLSLEQELRRGAVRRKLRLATQCYTAYHWLPPLITELELAHPNVQVVIDLQGVRDPIRQLETGKLDLAICHDEPPRAKSWSSVPLFDDPFVVVLGNDHPLIAQKRIKPAQLTYETLLLYEVPTDTLARLAKDLFPDENDVPRRVERVPLTEAIVALVRSGRGVSIMSEWAMRPYVSRGDITTRPLSGRAFRRWRAVWSKHGELAEPINALVHLIRDNDSLRR